MASSYHKIYLAGRFSTQSLLKEYRNQLERAGFVCTSGWLDEKGPPEGKLGKDTGETSHAFNAERDLKDIRNSDLVILFTVDENTPTVRGGRHYESGFAAGLGKPLWLVGPRENVFHYLLKDAAVFPYFYKALEALMALRSQAQVNISQLWAVQVQQANAKMPMQSNGQGFFYPAEKGGFKKDSGKPQFDLIPTRSLEDLVAVYTMGAKKYPPHNWRQGMAWSRVFAATMRHLWAFWRGEETDQESGLPHLAHAGYGIFTLLEYSKNHRNWDDREDRQAEQKAASATLRGWPEQDISLSSVHSRGQEALGQSVYPLRSAEVESQMYVASNAGNNPSTPPVRRAWSNGTGSPLG